LSAAQKEKILALTMHNLQLENRNYLYNHFSDNCVTRITNTLDEALDGQFYRQASATPSRFTLRQEIRRFMPKYPVWDLFLNFLMGRVIDKEISMREAMFLPEEAGKFIWDFTYIDDAGKKQPLCSSAEIVYEAKRDPPLAAPKSLAPLALAGGCLIAFLFAFARFFCESRWPLAAKRFIGIGQACLGFLFGVCGVLLFFLEFFTNHDYTYENFNLIFANPLLLIAFPAGLVAAFSSSESKTHKAGQALSLMWTYIFLAALAAMTMKILPLERQDNWPQLAFILPIAFTLGKTPAWARAGIKRLLHTRCL
jgi:hypothetical protein